MAKTKKKISYEKLTIDLMRFRPSELDNLPEADRQSVQFGAALQPFEYIGQGLPALGNKYEIGKWNLNLDIRISYHENGITYLDVARPGGRTFHQFEFEGIELNDAILAHNRFNDNFEIFIIYYGIFFLFHAYYLQRGKKKDRDEAYDATIKSFENYFKGILKPKRRREVDKREIVPGRTLTRYETIETGREPTTEAQLERKKQHFLTRVFAALDEIESYGGKRTQIEVAAIIFPDRDEADIRSLIKDRCRRFGLKWKEILKEFDRQKKWKKLI